MDEKHGLSPVSEAGCHHQLVLVWTPTFIHWYLFELQLLFTGTCLNPNFYSSKNTWLNLTLVSPFWEHLDLPLWYIVYIYGLQGLECTVPFTIHEVTVIVDSADIRMWRNTTDLVRIKINLETATLDNQFEILSSATALPGRAPFFILYII